MVAAGDHPSLFCVLVIILFELGFFISLKVVLIAKDGKTHASYKNRAKMEARVSVVEIRINVLVFSALVDHIVDQVGDIFSFLFGSAAFILKYFIRISTFLP